MNEPTKGEWKIIPRKTFKNLMKASRRALNELSKYDNKTAQRVTEELRKAINDVLNGY